jgi:isopropylmalate/homocitrate/citramalate synthase
MKKEDTNKKILTENYWLTEYNWQDKIRSQFHLPEKVQIHDATLREGQQTPGVVFREDEQVRIAQALDDLGVSSIEVIPMMSEEDVRATKRITSMGLNAKIYSFVSWNKKDIDLAIECGVDGVLVDYVGNPWQGKTFWGFEPEEIIKKGVEAMAYAKGHGLHVNALVWDDFKAPEDFLKQNYTSAVKEGGADTVSLADTFGFSLPWTMKDMVEKIRGWVPGTPVELHVHNDFGMATALSLSGVTGGASVVHTAMLGLGERCGNAATEEVALTLELLLGVDTGIHLDKIYETCELLQKISKFSVGQGKPLIGSGAFRFASGWICWMQKKAAEAGRMQGMLPFKPELIGRLGMEHVLGKSSGKASLKLKLDELGISVSSEEDLKKILDRVRSEGIITKGALEDSDVRRIVGKVLSK